MLMTLTWINNCKFKKIKIKVLNSLILKLLKKKAIKHKMNKIRKWMGRIDSESKPHEQYFL